MSLKMSTTVFFVIYLALVGRVFSLPTAINVKTVNKSESSERSLASLDILSELSDIPKRVQSLTAADALPIVESVEGVHGRRVKRKIMSNGNCAAGEIDLRGICLSPEEFYELSGDEEFNEGNENTNNKKKTFNELGSSERSFASLDILSKLSDVTKHVQSHTEVDGIPSADSVEGVHGRRVKRSVMNYGNCAAGEIDLNGRCLSPEKYDELTGN